MGFTNTHRKKLREALIAAYPDEEDLELMLEDQLDLPLNEIPHANKYPSQVSNLIKWAESEGKLRHLVIGASKNNPSNPKLKACVQELLPDLADDIDPELLPQKWVAKLLTILKNLQELAIAQSCCEAVISEVWEHRPEVKEDLENPELVMGVKWLILLGLLLKDYSKKTNGSLYIIEFVSCLRKYSGISTQDQEALSQWLQEVIQETNCTIPSQLQPEKDVSEQKVTALRGYLVIVGIPQVTPPEGENQRPSLLVHGAISVEAWYPDKITLRCLINDLQGLPIVISDLTPVQENFRNWVYQAEHQLESEAKKLSCVYDLTVEFLLPYEYLAEAVDRWDTYAGPIRWQELGPVGRKHWVVLRSLDRLKDSYLFNSLDKNWQRVEKVSQANPEIGAIQAENQDLICLNSNHWNKSGRLVLQLTCSNPTCRISSKAQSLGQLFRSILKSGTPVFLWSRQCNLTGSNVASEMNQLLTPELLCNPDHFLEEVRRMREAAATDQSLGQHLAVLYDEPQRLRQLEQFLPQDDQLWGMGA